jgi:hypothetical protein
MTVVVVMDVVGIMMDGVVKLVSIMAGGVDMIMTVGVMAIANIMKAAVNLLL